eukprot:m.47581 g.47581  ORF g.47581 m.47581 type:complete len:129 (-) comp5987_c0_seq3:2025-2411(-)
MMLALYNMDLSGGCGFEDQKREIQVPYVTGMSGIGKSRFARQCIQHLAQQAGAELNEHPTSLLVEARVATLVTKTTGASIPSQFVQDLAKASYHNTNLRIDCSRSNFATNVKKFTHEYAVCHALLVVA